MPSARRLVPLGLLLGSALAAVAYGGARGSTGGDDDVLGYRSGVRLSLQQTGRRREGVLRVEQFTYASVDGSRVPAQLAIPTDKPPRGCLIFVPGFTQPKEASPELRQRLALLRLATFSIDARDVGARGSAELAVQTSKRPEGVRDMLLGTVADLRVGLDYLERRRECHANVGVLGISFGGSVATHLAAQDRRIRAAVISSVGATYKQTILMQPQAAKSVPNLPNYVAGAQDPEVLEHAVGVLRRYDLQRWIGRIAPRPVLLINGRYDPIVAPGDALQLAAAVRPPKTILYYDGGHDPFASGPGNEEVAKTTTDFLVRNMSLSIVTR
jgi:pimeloyl-ACP methyl ester carboxylesterase